MMYRSKLRSHKGEDCPRCGCNPGDYHNPGCDAEECPFCGRYLYSCGCIYEKLGISKKATEKDLQTFSEMVVKAGRIPHIRVPQLCAICGKKSPGFFYDDDWEKYAPQQLQKEILCLQCYNWLKLLFPDGWRNEDAPPLESLPAIGRTRKELIDYINEIEEAELDDEPIEILED